MDCHGLQRVFAARPKQARPKQRVLQELAASLALVSQGIRSGYLFDSLTLSEEEAERLAELDAEIAVVRATGDDPQWFCVNTRLVTAKLQAKSYPLWVELAGGVTILPEPPEGLEEMFQDIADQLKALSTIVQTRKAGANILCPLAAFLIDYPVAYVPLGSPDFGGDLTVVELVLHGSGRQSLMKFSHPAGLAADVNVGALRDLIELRIQGTTWTAVEVSFTQVSSTGIVL